MLTPPTRLPAATLNGLLRFGSFERSIKNEIKLMKYSATDPNTEIVITTEVRPVEAATIPMMPAVIRAAVGVCLLWFTVARILGR